MIYQISAGEYSDYSVLDIIDVGNIPDDKVRQMMTEAKREAIKLDAEYQRVIGAYIVNNGLDMHAYGTYSTARKAVGASPLHQHGIFINKCDIAGCKIFATNEINWDEVEV
jgi:hypothetical protein